MSDKAENQVVSTCTGDQDTSQSPGHMSNISFVQWRHLPIVEEM